MDSNPTTGCSLEPIFIIMESGLWRQGSLLVPRGNLVKGKLGALGVQGWFSGAKQALLGLSLCPQGSVQLAAVEQGSTAE